MGMGKVTRTSQGISALFKFQINAVLGGIIKVLKYRQKKKKAVSTKMSWPVGESSSTEWKGIVLWR